MANTSAASYHILTILLQHHKISTVNRRSQSITAVVVNIKIISYDKNKKNKNKKTQKNVYTKIAHEAKA